MNLSPNHTLQARQQKIQEKRKQTPWRDFVMEIASRMPFNFYKNNSLITPYCADIPRIGGVLDSEHFEETRNTIELKEYGSLFETLEQGLRSSHLAGIKVVGKNENSQFSYITLGAKNSYLSIVVVDSESVFYTYNSFLSNDIINSILVQKSQHVYQSRIISNSSSIFYSSNIEDSHNIRFSSNLLGCFECIDCNNLHNKKFCISNIEYDENNYKEKKREILVNKKSYNLLYKKTLLEKGTNIGENITGSFNKLCNNVENGFMNYQLQNGRNIVFCNATDLLENAKDCCSIGGTKSDNIYACMGVGYGCSHIYCSVECSPFCNSLYYCYLLDSCSFCLGCIGLKNKSYCIFNKQYTKEEWYIKVDEIFGQMDRDGTLGQFFPPSMNPFYFNDTAAYLIDSSFTKEEVTAKGYLRRDEPIKVDIPDGMKIINIDELENYEGRMTNGIFTTLSAIRNPQSNNSTWYINPEVLKVIIQDEQGNIYKIVKMEYDFLMKHGLPLPRKHRLDRMKENFKIN